MLAEKRFADEVAEKIAAYLPPEYAGAECRPTETVKNNGVRMAAVTIRMPGQKAAPVFYVRPYLEEARAGRPMEGILSEIAEEYRKAASRGLLPEGMDYADYGEVKGCLSVSLVNTAANREQLKGMPHREMEDLSLICRIELPDPDGGGKGAIRVQGWMLEQWGVTEEDLFSQAMENARAKEPPVLSDLFAAMDELAGFPGTPENLLAQENPEPGGPMFLLTNQSRVGGASVLAYPGVAEQVDRLFPEGCYILPSSVHEALVVPKSSGISPKELGAMVREVNRQAVAKEERLSDRVYAYDREKGRLAQVPESMEIRRDYER